MEIKDLYLNGNSLKGTLNFFYDDAKHKGKSIEYYKESESRWKPAGRVSNIGELNIDINIGEQQTISFRTADCTVLIGIFFRVILNLFFRPIEAIRMAFFPKGMRRIPFFSRIILTGLTF